MTDPWTARHAMRDPLGGPQPSSTREALVFRRRARTSTMLFFGAMSIFWVVETVTIHKNKGFVGAIALLSLWTGWTAFREGLFAGPSGVRLARSPGIGILSFIRTVRVPWSDIDRFEFRPGGRASYFAQLIRASDQRAIPIPFIGYPRDEYSRFYAKWHATAEAQMDQLNGLLQASRESSAKREPFNEPVGA